MFTAFVESALNVRAPDGWDMKWFRGLGWCSARRHNDCFEKSLDWGADLICILGSDQVYQPDILQRLVDRHQAGCDAVAALVPLRIDVGSYGVGTRLAWKLENKNFVPIDVDAAELQRIDCIGSGVVLFPADVLRKLKKPWMKETIDGENFNRIPNGDTGFVFRMSNEAGVKIWADTTIKVGHVTVQEIN